MNAHRLPRVVTIAYLVTSLIAPAAFAAGQEPLKSLSSLEVVDAHEQKVGSVFSLYQLDPGASFETAVVFEADHQPFVVIVRGNVFAGRGSGPFFQSSNCSGPPLVGRDTQSIIAVAVISAPGHTAYVAEPDATPQSFNPFQGTQLRPSGTCEPFTTTGNINLLAARAVVDLDPLFTPPFSVR